MPRQEQAREKILAAADELFGQAGFDATTTREIAERSGVNKALIHYHFRSKDELLESLLDRYYARLAATLMPPLQAEGDLRQRMTRLLDAYVDFLAENTNFAHIVQREAAAGKHMERIQGHMVPLFQIGTTTLEQMLPATRDGEMAAPHLLVSFYGMVIGWFTWSTLLQRLMGTDPLSPENLELRKRHLTRVVDAVLQSVDGGS